MEIVLYNKNGRPIAYTEDWATIYLYTGEPVAYLSESAAYTFAGTLLGWFVEGRLVDRAGRDVFFTNLSMGRPATPLKLASLPKGVKRARPVRRLREPEPVRPPRMRAWAVTSSGRFFRPLPVACSPHRVLTHAQFQKPHRHPMRKSQVIALVA
jgi:hypothetical protein